MQCNLLVLLESLLYLYSYVLYPVDSHMEATFLLTRDLYEAYDSAHSHELAEPPAHH